MALWSLRERPPARLSTVLEVAGVVLVVGVWWTVCAGLGIPKSVLPSPGDVFRAFPALLTGHGVPTAIVQGWPLPGTDTNTVFWHLLASVLVNLAAYVVAIGIAVPLGFVVGLFGPFRAMTERQIAMFRYAPITAFMGVFVRWFGISWTVKIAFLAAGVLVYLVPAVIQRIDEVDTVLTDTAKTCGATRWQRIRTVFWPLVIGRLSDDCRSLVPITWTYLVLAEFNVSEGGLGALVNNYTRSSRWDLVFALVVIICIFGFCQDKIWTWADRLIFPWKYV